MQDKYTYTVAWSEDDEAYVARVAEFRSLAAHGDNPDEALKELRFVVRTVVDDLQQEGSPVPEPLGECRYSGRLNVRMPASLHRELVMEAARQGVSLNQLINLRLASASKQ